VERPAATAKPVTSTSTADGRFTAANQPRVDERWFTWAPSGTAPAMVSRR